MFALHVGCIQFFALICAVTAELKQEAPPLPLPPPPLANQNVIEYFLSTSWLCAVAFDSIQCCVNLIPQLINFIYREKAHWVTEYKVTGNVNKEDSSSNSILIELTVTLLFLSTSETIFHFDWSVHRWRVGYRFNAVMYVTSNLAVLLICAVYRHAHGKRY